MKKLLSPVVLLVLLSLFTVKEVHAQNNPPPPDCVIVLNNWTTAQSSSSFPNYFTACQTWTFQYTSVGFTGLTITVQSAPAATATTPGTFVTYAGTVSTGINPNTNTQGRVTTFSNGLVDIPWIRVNLSGLMGTGTVFGVLYGYKTGYAGNGGGGGGGVCPGGTIDGEVQYKSGANCAGDPNLTWATANGQLLFGPAGSNYVAFDPLSDPPGSTAASAVFAQPTLPINYDFYNFAVAGTPTMANGSYFANISSHVAGSSTGTTFVDGLAVVLDAGVVTQGVNSVVSNATTGTGYAAQVATGATNGVSIGFNVVGASSSGTGATEAYGLKVANINTAASNFAIKTGTGLVSLGDKVTAPLYATTTNCADSAGAAACGAAPAGAFVVDAGSTSTVVSTTAVTANSEILVAYDASLSTRLGITCNAAVPPVFNVSARTAGTSFTLTSSAPVTNPGCFVYSIIN